MPEQPSTTVLEHVRALAPEVSNWGRWGEKDQRGTLNLVDAAAVRRGAEAIVDGTSFSLALPADMTSPTPVGQPTRRPALRTPIQINFAWTGDTELGQFNDDNVEMGVQAGTHWDALSHMAYNDQLYNGFPASTVTAEFGARKCGIHRVGPVSSRAVLVDVARYLGVDHMENGERVDEATMDAVVAAQGDTVEPGDIVLVRTGQMARRLAGDTDGYGNGCPGLEPEVTRWFKQHDVAAYAIDTQSPDPFPAQDDTMFVPFHLLALRDMGLLQGQHWNLEALAEACAADGRYTCHIAASPIPITGASGAPVAPVATR